LPESSASSSTPKPQDKKFTGRGPNRTQAGMTQRFVDVLGWVITAAWSISMILHAANIGYEPPVSIHALMAVVAGAAFGTNLIKPRNGEKNGK
jgi:hypothetical protein